MTTLEPYLAVITDLDGLREPFADLAVALARWQRGGLALAAVTTERDARPILDQPGLRDRFDLLVDPAFALENELAGKPDLVAAAAAELGVPLDRCVLLVAAAEDAPAAHEVGGGLVIGIERQPEARPDTQPTAAATPRVVSDLSGLRFPRVLPSLPEARRAFDELRDGRPLAVFLDFDGTLSPIVDDPDAASIDDATRQAVLDLMGQATVAIVSGRDRRDVEQRARIDGIYYAGSHGMDIAGPGRELAQPAAEAAVEEVAAAENTLRDELAGIDGVVIERKRFSVAVHDRMVQDEHLDRVREATSAVLDRSEHLRPRAGKRVVELVPAIDWDKGRAVDWLLDALEIDPAQTLVLYVGDDETDEDAMQALAGRGLGIHVGPEISDSLADFRLADPEAVVAFLRVLAAGPS